MVAKQEARTSDTPDPFTTLSVRRSTFLRFMRVQARLRETQRKPGLNKSEVLEFVLDVAEKGSKKLRACTAQS